MKLFSFRGRTHRWAYLGVAVTSYLVVYPLLTVAKTCESALGLSPKPLAFFWPALSRLVQSLVGTEEALVTLILSWLAMVVMFVVVLAFGVRRLRDANLSGWYVLTPLLMPALLPLAAQGDVGTSVVEVLFDILLVALPPTDKAWRFGPILSGPARPQPAEVF